MESLQGGTHPRDRLGREGTTVLHVLLTSLLFFRSALGQGDLLGGLLGLPTVPRPGLCIERVIPSGYACDEHTVTTEDGYILSLQKVTRHGAPFAGRPTLSVFLMHGILVGGAMWLHTVPGQDWEKQFLPFYLADAGYEVWIAHSRGTLYSNRHTNFSSSDTQYWQWTWDEQVRYDFPAMVTYAAAKSVASLQGLHFIGHGLGNLIGMAGTTNPAIAPLIASATLLAPAVFLSNVGSALLGLWSYVTGPAIDGV
eukprot:jgi/Mesen1/3088/ME000184S02151